MLDLPVASDRIVPPSHFEPAPGSGFLARTASSILRLTGWRIVLAQPVPLRCVVVFYPHTSNWDFPIGLLAKWATCIHFRFVGKDTLFKGPFAVILDRWGGIPVNRREPSGFIGQMTAAFERHPDFRLVIAPEGTRRRTAYWKSGFYHLARAARVPVALAFIDYRRREIGVGGYVDLGGDVAADMAAIAAFYADKRGRRPAQQAPVRLRDERSAAN